MPSLVDELVEPDRVHRRVYVDPEVFALEIERIYESTWIYCGHLSQIPRSGDYAAVEIGRQRLLMVRDAAGNVNVLYNRCPHRGVELCGRREGNVGARMVCPYHSWTFRLDGSFESMPAPAGYDGTRLDLRGPDASMRKAARVDHYRGFVFASLSHDVPSLAEFLGEARVAFDDMCERSPEGEVEIVRPSFRVVQRSNWKFFMENQLDALHAPITHQAAAAAAAEIEKEITQRTGAPAPDVYKPLSAVLMPLPKWDTLESVGFPYGHALLTGYLGGPADRSNLHHVLIYPSLSIQPAMQQLRVIRPVAVDRTVSELWHFRLKGAPPAAYDRALNYFNLINSPATLVNADDLENWSRGQRGLATSGGDWVSFHRNAGTDRHQADGTVRSANGFSETPMRHQFAAWRRYLQGAIA